MRLLYCTAITTDCQDVAQTKVQVQTVQKSKLKDWHQVTDSGGPKGVSEGSQRASATNQLLKNLFKHTVFWQFLGVWKPPLNVLETHSTSWKLHKSESSGSALLMDLTSTANLGNANLFKVQRQELTLNINPTPKLPNPQMSWQTSFSWCGSVQCCQNYISYTEMCQTTI